MDYLARTACRPTVIFGLSPRNAATRDIFTSLYGKSSLGDPVSPPPAAVHIHRHHSLREYKHHTSRMATIGGSTPQLKFAQRWIDAHLARDCKIDGLFSKDYKHQTLPESLGLPEETREEYMKRYEGILHVVTEMGVRIQHRISIPGSWTDVHYR